MPPLSQIETKNKASNPFFFPFHLLKEQIKPFNDQKQRRVIHIAYPQYAF